MSVPDKANAGCKVSEASGVPWNRNDVTARFSRRISHLGLPPDAEEKDDAGGQT
jgi:hypothetical protein